MPLAVHLIRGELLQHMEDRWFEIQLWEQKNKLRKWNTLTIDLMAMKSLEEAAMRCTVSVCFQNPVVYQLPKVQ